MNDDIKLKYIQIMTTRMKLHNLYPITKYILSSSSYRTLLKKISYYILKDKTVNVLHF